MEQKPVEKPSGHATSLSEQFQLYVDHGEERGMRILYYSSALQKTAKKLIVEIVEIPSELYAVWMGIILHMHIRA